MELQFRNFMLLFILVVATVLVSADESKVKKLITQELKKFADVMSKTKEPLNITISLSTTEMEEVGDYVNIKKDTVTMYAGKTAKGAHDSNVKNLQEIEDRVFKLAQELNISAIVSKEKYSEDGSLLLKKVHTPELELDYEDGASKVTYQDKTGELVQEEEELENFIEMLKDYELPVEVHKIVYNEAGNVIKDTSTTYQPRKVKLLGGEIPCDMKLEIAEALKQASVTKTDPKDRIGLTTRYLKVRYPGYSWSAVTGPGPHHINKDVDVDLELDGEFYKFWGKE